MEVTHELLGYDHLKIIQNEEMFCFSLDSMLLANFVYCGPRVKQIIDLGCGNAPIPLFLTMKTKAKIVGIEIQEEVASLAKRSVALNNLQNQIEILHADFNGIYKNGFANQFQIVISNPPYFKHCPTSNINKNEYLTIARHEIKATLEGVIIESKRLLTDGGSLYMVHRVERLDEILMHCAAHNFSPKRLQFIYTKTTSQEALLVLIEARKNRKQGLKVERPIYCYQENGEYTEEVKKIFNFNKV